ncbi:Tetracycline resistance protein TetA/multidrug resistance protein MdtG [Penicillium waksmanii]|uniref:Tetracycline resistance protein TetA/multidrug resistance protein MdtG n=1 Tax=Penicillium waksmanii TaxID=69791 RepID=UPI0025491624|nr:Tetracycline resistance protein TetA/multidrug resistance protein MdtG [Penicillium waksmanii]KAJ5965807.1 Tetracycline resistance protein TetA/multidrug resistance protein MdtG [Penicillium waksmanii]
MGDFYPEPTPIGYKWRSSRWFILTTITVALFSETFLYGFIVPILPYMLQFRLHINPSQTQKFTSAILALHGFVSVVSGPIIGHFADKTPSRRIPLLLSLFACIISTGIVSITSSMILLFIGRVIQGVAASAVWIVGFATIADAVGQENSGTVMGLTMSFVNVGMISGPAAAGLLLEVGGYWIAWLTPLLILIIDLAARLVMIEYPLKDPSPLPKEESGETPRTAEISQTTETACLLSPQQETVHTYTATDFWRIMMCDPRALTVLSVVTSGTAVAGSFEATLPLHVQETFGYGPGTTGFLFSALVIPGLLISPLAGWIRDRIGIRLPAVISLTLQAALLGLLGIAGSDRVSWASAQSWGGTIYTASIFAIGACRPITSGMGPVELPGKCIPLLYNSQHASESYLVTC